MGSAKVIAVDYDGTLFDGKRVNAALVARLRAEQAKGNHVILWTCREAASLRDAVETLARHGFRPNYVNANSPVGIAHMGHDSRKVFADVYIDDKAAR